MTATQVFLRFLKENGLYGELYPYISDAIRKSSTIPCKADKLKEAHKGKNVNIDKLLKRSLSDLSTVFHRIYQYSSKIKEHKNFNFYKVQKLFTNFLRTNVDGNYFKVMIPDNNPQTVSDAWGRFRNGYHVLDFKWKKTSPYYGTRD